MDLAVDPHPPLGAGKHHGVVKPLARPLGKARDDVQPVPHRDPGETVDQGALDGFGACRRVAGAGQRKLGQHQKCRAGRLRFGGEGLDAGKVRGAVVTGGELRHGKRRGPGARQRLMAVKPEVIEGVPRETICHQRLVKRGAAHLEDRLAQHPADTGAGRVDQAGDDRVARIHLRLDAAIGADDAAAARELHRALEPPAVRLDHVAAVLEGAGDPVGRGGALGQPVRDVADHIGAGEGFKPHRLEEMQVHADQDRDPPDRRVEDLMRDIARGRPFRFRDIGVRLAVRADHPPGSDQRGAVVIEVGDRIDLGQAHHDVAVMRRGDLAEALGRRAGDGLDLGGDLGAVVPAIARRSHLGHHDQPRPALRRLAAHPGKRGDVRLLREHRRFELDRGDLERGWGGHGGSP
ncbi:hypothetical protein SDC9_35800 [bioreactor metagenome]|uniref:Uncharacterized protein n=1 Tax=bioreactor metagenome TaxID=1076179 RepID=A0A644VEL6_9ZZZZ